GWRRALPVRRCADDRRRLPRPAALQCQAVQRAARRLSDIAAGGLECERARRICSRSSRPAEGARMNRVDDINRGVADVKPLESVEIPSLKGKVSDEEWAIRVDLAAAYRMIAH